MEHGDSKAQVKGGRSLSSAIRANTGCGPMEQVWRFLVFLGLCFMLFILGLVKGSIVGLPSALIIFAGHMAVVIGLWPVHVFGTYRTLAMTKKLGLFAKVLSLLLVPIPLLLWPCVVVMCSLLGGLGYGFGQPLVATFEAVGENRNAKFHHSLTDGTYTTLKGSCTVVRDFTDFTFHSYFDLIDEFRTGELKGAKPFDIKLVEIPGCILVGLLGLIVDTPIISLVALAKSPLMLLKGWRQLILDLVGQPSSCVACGPFAGLAIVLWPLVVCATVLSAIFCSPFLGLFGAVIVYQENSFCLGLSHVVAVVAEFDEYSNDVLDLNEGSCLPRPRYRRSTMESKRSGVVSKPDIESGTRETVPRESFSRPEGPQLNTQRSLKQTLQEVKLVQMWDHVFTNLDSGGKVLIDAGVLRPSDLEKFIKNSRNPNIKWVAVGVPAYCTLQGLLASAKSGTAGFLLLTCWHDN
ncbi:hypothetical protein BDL97_10G106500 [Sphagnum fallax]|nr:hypothetical protein BDL97_10G106500 [Sphagnum fallax]